MYIAVPFEWLAKCGNKRSGLGTTPKGGLFKVIKVDDFGSRGKMYKVEMPYGDWVVWDIHGVVEYTDEEIERFN